MAEKRTLHPITCFAMGDFGATAANWRLVRIADKPVLRGLRAIQQNVRPKACPGLWPHINCYLRAPLVRGGNDPLDRFFVVLTPPRN